MQDTVLVIGDSPFLGEVEDRIFYLLERYNSIGINRVILKYPIQNIVFTDFPIIQLANKYPNINSITLYSYGDIVLPKRELFKTFAFDLDKNTEEDIDKDELAWCGFSHDVAISYAIKKGYKRIILIGAADFIEGGHHTNKSPFNYSEGLREFSVRFIEEFCTKRVQIYTCNPNSCLRVPYLPVDDLLT